jgi:beta-glucosidase/6-phospho-beta-glucosidase/beta-galactosidase
MSDWEWAVLPNGVQTATRESTDHISTMLFVGPAKTHTGNTLLVTRDKANNETRMTYIQTSPNQ